MTDVPYESIDGWDEFCRAMLENRTTTGPCMSLYVCRDSKSVELILDTSVSTVAEWIKGEGGDMCLYRCRATGKVMGCRLPLYQDKLVVTNSGASKTSETQ